MAETVVVEETGAGSFQVRVMAGSSTFLVDEPLDVGGLGTGPNPYDLLSAALGSCTAMTIRLYSRRKTWPLAQVRVAVTHHRDSLTTQDVFVRQIQLVGTLDDEQTKRIMDIAGKCPVHLTLERGSTVQTMLVSDEPMDNKVIASPEHMRDMDETCSEYRRAGHQEPRPDKD